MPIETVPELVRLLSKYPLLEAAQRDELEGILKAQYTDPRTLSKELLLRGWLTPFQVNQLFQDRATELMLGSYVIIERLTEGAVGQLYRARHQHMKRAVALQVVRPELLRDPAAVERFYQEIQAVSQLSSQHLVAAYDAGPIGNTHFFAMEYVDGIDLERLVQQSGPLPIEQAVAFIRQAAQGLQHAAERGLLHHDLRPANLLLARLGGTGQPPSGEGSSKRTHGSDGAPLLKIRNLGLTLIRQHTKHTRLQVGQSPEPDAAAAADYLAPERPAGSPCTDVRAELYSLGCTFYFLLTGQVPFPGGSAADKIRRHQEEEPVPVEMLRPDTPPEIASIVRVLMSKNPADRFPRPGDVAAVLTPETSHRANGANRAAPSGYQLKRTAQQKRLTWLILAGAAVLLLGVIGLVAAIVATQGTPAVPPTTGPAAEGSGLLSVTVEAQRPWQDTFIDVTAGSPVVFRARGRWRRGPRGADSGPEGNPLEPRDRCVLQDFPAMTLLAMVNDVPIAVGAARNFDPPRSGRLFVQANDLDLKDNSGAVVLEVTGGTANPVDALVWQFGYGDLHDGEKKLRSFMPLSYWPNPGIWAPRPTVPADRFSHLFWNPTTGVGHTGPNRGISPVRRCLVPRDAVLGLNGTLTHLGKGGDGVRAWLLVPRLGVRGGPWHVLKNQVETRVTRFDVKQGDQVEAVVDCRDNDQADSFSWSPALQVLEWGPAPTRGAR